LLQNNRPEDTPPNLSNTTFVYISSKILDFIDNKKIDMVVMCRKGKTGNFDMGGVAQKVVVNSPVPVVIAPASKKNKGGNPSTY